MNIDNVFDLTAERIQQTRLILEKTRLSSDYSGILDAEELLLDCESVFVLVGILISNCPNDPRIAVFRELIETGKLLFGINALQRVLVDSQWDMFSQVEVSLSRVIAELDAVLKA